MTVPLASNVNFVAGETVPNHVSATLGIRRAAEPVHAAGTAHVVAYVARWFDAG